MKAGCEESRIVGVEVVVDVVPVEVRLTVVPDEAADAEVAICITEPVCLAFQNTIL